PGAGLDVLGVALEQALVGVALDVDPDHPPRLAVDEVADQPAELGRVADLVLGLAEDQAEQAVLLAEELEGLAVVLLERLAVLGCQRLPVVALGHGRRPLPRRRRVLVGHLQEQQIGELLGVVAVGQAVVTQDVAVGPELVDEVGGVAHGVYAVWAWMRARNSLAGSSLGSWGTSLPSKARLRMDWRRRSQRWRLRSVVAERLCSTERCRSTSATMRCCSAIGGTAM